MARLAGPFARIPGPVRRPLLGKSIGAMLAVGALMGPSDRKMKATGGPGIVPLELAGSRDQVDQILETWGPEGRAGARESLVLDQAWLTTYALSLALSAAEAGEAFEDRGWGALAGLAGPVGWGALVAGLLDGIENASLLGVVDGSPSTALPRIAQRCAQVKFALVLAAIPYGLAGLAVGGRVRAADRARAAGR